MNYYSIQFNIVPFTRENTEILIALLDDAGYEGIHEPGDKIIAYISKSGFDTKYLDEYKLKLEALGCQLSYTIEPIAERNWNSEWESNFDPVLIGERCAIRAPFHSKFEEYEYCITIEPKMSFGTGHHYTTRLMIEQMLTIQFSGTAVLDMGCGTGVLGILASMRGAEYITALDNDKWAWENTRENLERNNIRNAETILGGGDAIPSKQFDIILANINRNILAALADNFSLRCKPGGYLIISGILEEDKTEMMDIFSWLGFKCIKEGLSNGWLMMMFERK